jgi:hypothetical protein
MAYFSHCGCSLTLISVNKSRSRVKKVGKIPTEPVSYSIVCSYNKVGITVASYT